MTPAHHSSNYLQRCFRSFRAVIENKPAGAIVVRKNLFQSDPQLIEKVILGALKGVLYIRQNRAGTIPILARLMKIEGEIAAKIFDLLLPASRRSGRSVRSSRRRYLNLCRGFSGSRRRSRRRKSMTLLQ